MLKARRRTPGQTTMPPVAPSSCPRATLGRRGRGAGWFVGMVLAMAVLVSCGPIGGEEKPATPTPVLLPAASPIVRPLPTSVTTSVAPPAATPEASPRPPTVTTPVASPAPASPTVRQAPKPTKTPRPKRAPTSTPRPVVASDCIAPDDLPPATQDEPVSVTENGVNLRTAPGITCDIIQVVDAGTMATPKTGPVEADDRLWILVDVSGVEGWVALDFVE